MEVEEVVNNLGGFGRMQVVILVATYVTAIFAGAPAVQDSFINYTPKYRCKIPNCDQSDAVYQEDFFNFTIPDDKAGHMKQCKMYNTFNYSTEISGSCSSEYFNPNTSIGCEGGYVYDTSIFTSTAVTQFDLVCDDKYLTSLVTSMYTAGMLVSSLMIGVISDKFGRRNAFLLGVIMELVGMVAGSFSVNYGMLIVFRTMAGVGAVALFNVIFVIVVEYMPTNCRSGLALGLNVLFAFGEVFVGVAAYFVRDWRHLQLIISVPVVVLFISYWFIPESLRWLVNKEKFKELKQTLDRISKMNKVPPLEKIDFKKSEVQTNTNKSMVDLLKKPKMRTITLSMFYIWFAANMVYYGMTQNTGNIAGNIFVNFIAMMLIEVPSYLFVIFFFDKFGHKRSLFMFLLICTIACLTCGCLDKDSSPNLIIGLSLLGKFGGAGAFGMIYMYTCELFPTEYRSLGVGACSMCARISGLVSPVIATLGLTDERLPFIIFGSVSLVSVGCCFFVPETAGMPLPQTIEDCEKQSEEGYFDFLIHWKKPTPTEEVKSEKQEEVEKIHHAN